MLSTAEDDKNRWMNTLGINTSHPFVANLLLKHRYTSPPHASSALFPTLRYYQGLTGLIVKCSWVARNNTYSNQDFFDTSYNTLKLVEKIGGQVDISGLEHLAGLKSAAVIVCNHMSLLETFLLPCALVPFKPLCIVIKKELTEYAGFGKTMSAINHIAVTRDNPRADFRTVLEKGAEFLKNGVSILIFPQSTRNPVFVPAEFNTLGEKLAAKAGCPVVPVAIKTDLHGTGSLIKEFGRIDVSKPVKIVVGPALDPVQEGRGLHDKVIRFIGDNLRSWGLPVQDAPPAADTAP